MEAVGDEEESVDGVEDVGVEGGGGGMVHESGVDFGGGRFSLVGCDILQGGGRCGSERRRLGG